MLIFNDEGWLRLFHRGSARGRTRGHFSGDRRRPPSLSAHARNEAYLDGLAQEDLYDIIAFHDEVTKDFPDNDLGRAPGLNFIRWLEDGRRALVKVGWNMNYGFYIIVTAMAN